MSAAQHNIVIEEGADLQLEYTYRDSDKNIVDVTGYGGTIVIAGRNGERIFKGDDGDGSVVIGGSNGLVTVGVDYTNFENLKVKEGKWQLYIYPTSGDITDRPKRFVEGMFRYSKSLL